MKLNANNFIPVAEIAVTDPQLTAAVKRGTQAAFNNREAAMYAFGHEHGQGLRQQAAEAKRRALRQLPELLEQAEANMQASGIEVRWAIDAAEAQQHVLEIVRQHGVQRVAKSKSMLTEETGINTVLEKEGVHVVETDLGEFIIQLADEPPSHIIAPVIHKSKESIRDLFIDTLGMAPTDDAAQMTHFARQHLRDVFLAADLGISGGNFLIAETGTICLVTNEGNGRMVTTLPKVHIAMIGIEKIVENLDDYATLTQVIARSGTGQSIAVYSHMINGPRRDDAIDGPEHLYVILVDNGRSDIYQTDYAEVLSCIRCGACLNGCPVYRSTGGHAYGWAYSGPIGAVITPLLNGLENAAPLPHASSLCGTCKAVCPVDIDLPRMLLDLRHDLVREGHSQIMWDTGIKGWAITHRSPRLYRMAGKAARLGSKLTGDRLPGPLGGWTKYRDFPGFAPKSFHDLWQERQKGKHNDQS
jgi:L-lactate dehydrogenase complex protein LldF